MPVALTRKNAPCRCTGRRESLLQKEQRFYANMFTYAGRSCTSFYSHTYLAQV